MADGELILTSGLIRNEWFPKEKQTQLFGRGSSAPVIELGNPYWEITLTYQNMSRDDWAELQAWLARRRGAKSHFSAFRAMNRTPRGGATSCTASGASNGRVTVSASPALQAGDMVAFDATNGGRYVGILTELVSGTTWEAFPPAPVGSASPACVDAAGHFRLMPETIQMQDPLDPKKGLSFSARQKEPLYA